MKPTHTIRRLALAAALSGAALASTPALANAASTCTYSPSSLPARVDVFDGSGSGFLKLVRSGMFIAVQDAGGGISKLCPGPGGSFATVFNTDKIVVHGTASFSESVPFFIDQSAGAFAPGKTLETDGNSEIETVIFNNGVQPNMLLVNGTTGADTMRVAANGNVMLGSDNDIDIGHGTGDDPRQVEINGLGGSDFLSGRGGYPASSPAPATTPLTMFGGDGNDTLVDGPQKFDWLQGDAGNDTLYTVDGQTDNLLGGPDFDTATFDSNDVPDSTFEQLTRVDVGRLELDRTALKARAGHPTRVTLAWKHPKSWTQLRSLRLTANEAGDVLGSIRIDPARERISGHGALQATPRSTVTHHGKWVTARIWLRPSKRLAGHTLRLAVEATDVHGHQQLEPLAGTLTITN
jgi:hypothetical protein